MAAPNDHNRFEVEVSDGDNIKYVIPESEARVTGVFRLVAEDDINNNNNVEIAVDILDNTSSQISTELASNSNSDRLKQLIKSVEDELEDLMSFVNFDNNDTCEQLVAISTREHEMIEIAIDGSAFVQDFGSADQTFKNGVQLCKSIISELISGVEFYFGNISELFL